MVPRAVAYALHLEAPHLIPFTVRCTSWALLGLVQDKKNHSDFSVYVACVRGLPGPALLFPIFQIRVNLLFAYSFWHQSQDSLNCRTWLREEEGRGGSGAAQITVCPESAPMPDLSPEAWPAEWQRECLGIEGNLAQLSPWWQSVWAPTETLFRSLAGVAFCS